MLWVLTAAYGVRNGSGSLATFAAMSMRIFNHVRATCLSIGVGSGPQIGIQKDADYPENRVLIPRRNTAEISRHGVGTQSSPE
jgi:hypothetical protein